MLPLSENFNKVIIYNVTIKVNNEVEEDWLRWMKILHIPEVMDTGMFTEYKFCRLFDNLQNNEDGTTYCVQYFCKSLGMLHQYQVKYAQKLQKEHAEKYAGKFVAFRTILEVID